jgi:hypothetical protein
VKEA